MTTWALLGEQKSLARNALPSEAYTSSFGTNCQRTVSPEDIEQLVIDHASASRQPWQDRIRRGPRDVGSGSSKAPTTYAKALSGRERPADRKNGSIGPTPQPLRAFAGFAGQQVPPNRNPPLGSARLQNSKLGNGANWGFGLAANAAPGLPNSQARQTGTAATSFAQTIGSSQPATPLDLSEFPSLSGAPQAQFHNPSQAVWANANQRAVQHTPVQRPQQQHQTNPQNSSQQHGSSSHEGPRQVTEDLFSSNSQFQAGLDDYRHGVQGGVGQASGSGQPQTGNIEDFPPLGRNGIEGNGQDRRGSLMQNAAFATFSNTNGLNLSQTTGIPGTTPPSNQADNRAASTLADRIMSPNAMAFGGMDIITSIASQGSDNKLCAGSSLTRSPADPTRQNHPGLSDHEKNGLPSNRQREQNNHFPVSTLHDSQSLPQQQTSQSQVHQSARPQQAYGVTLSDSTAVTADRGASKMSDIDRFGLAGLLSTVRSDNPDVLGLATGQDLNQLGLNLNSVEPLYPTFAGPFAESGSRQMQLDFKLPECYTVDNVHRVREKIPGFSDETLFWIFYTQPRDIMQELAATEL
ncbi:MAG: hypothetical protein HETSPECPRED_007585 [Heterodermia speciosa]|uniref:NOT2/NOT3/NOT5 C-terminal domain-containing protein n=1 Tax=Heterodermia speciosa TaxID=116794 RepID=A0A8H3FZD1_9LECA|nr:MAG: hypothetical protein HETSPECPRED_007585 [Heterodermia speciosa]